jgi:hypothetical protein
MFIDGLGAFFFGITVGWIAYRILRRKATAYGFSDLIAILGIIGGAAVLALFRSDISFGWYSVGLILGFFAHFAVGVILLDKLNVQSWQAEPRPPTSTPDAQPES